MRLQPTWDYIVSHIFPLPSIQGGQPLFNPYADAVPGLDLPDAAPIRRENLHRYLAGFSSLPAYLLVGEAPGWRGCRFTGIPFSSEALLCQEQLPLGGEPTSLGPTRYPEASAALFWQALLPYYPNFLAWNSLPLHPHQPGIPLSNRPPTAAEVRRFAPLLAGLIATLSPVRVIAVGRKAELALRLAGIEAACIRHPGHGGKNEFLLGVRAIFDPSR